MKTIHVCRFDTVLDMPRKLQTYQNVKARVLEAGKFSIFEATHNDYLAGIFTRLVRDPGLEIDSKNVAYPWTAVRLRSPK